MNEPVSQVVFFNWWSVVHLCFWFTVAFFVTYKKHIGLPRLLGLSMVGAFAWEVVELILAIIPALWALSESAINRWVSDPLMALIAVPAGWWIARNVLHMHRAQRA